MSTQPRLNQILTGILVVQLIVAAFVFLPRTLSSQTEAGALLPDLEAGRVTAVTITSGEGQSLTLAQKDGAWVLASGGDYPTMEGDVPATRVTETPSAEGGILWAKDSEEIVYYSWRTGTPKLYAYDFTTNSERQITSGPGRDQPGEFSPDGSFLAYGRMVNEERELRVVDWESGDDRRSRRRFHPAFQTAFRPLLRRGDLHDAG
mgnify:CR=1 FL=1